MVEFPETAQSEWDIIADAAQATVDLKARIERATLVEREVEKLRRTHEAKTIFNAELAAETTPDLVVMTLADYQNNPVSQVGDLIEGAMMDQGLCLMLGPSGSGKSTLALQTLHSLMTGVDWLGQKVTKINGAVGAVSYDMPGSLMLDWMSGFPNIDASKVHMVDAYKQGNPLAVPAHRKTIADLWKARGVEVVLIDSFSASFFGRDQNDAAEAQAHYRDLKAFALNECGARAVIVIVHSTEGSPKKPRGSTVHQDVADAIVAVWIEDPKTRERHVDMTKYRPHRDPSGVMTSQMLPRVITAPDAVTHLVDLDLGAMTLAGMQHPPGVSATHLFEDEPELHEAPDTDPDWEAKEDEADL